MAKMRNETSGNKADDVPLVADAVVVGLGVVDGVGGVIF